MTPRKLMVVAGEKSGDLHASRIITSLKKLSPSVEVFGVGGESMLRSGAEILTDITGLAVVGLAEVASNYFTFRRLFRRLIEVARRRKPDVALLVDYPGFNLRLAPALKSLGVKVAYFVSPQVWAWGRRRINKMRKCVDRMIVVFDFEVPIYRRAGIDVVFVGHPLAEVLTPTMSREDFRREAGIPEEAKVVAILPGSRLQEVSRHVPVMGKAAEIIRGKVADARFILPAASEELAGECRRLLEKHRVSVPITIVKDVVCNAVSASDAAIVSSGTATLETGCLGVPLVVVYKISLLTYLIARRLITISNIGLINIVAGKTVAPEFVQREARPGAIAEEIVRFLTDPGVHGAVRRQLSEVRAKLGSPGASQRAARAILDLMGP
ncbi:lipid-A-disaccharide synthase [bacterium]|nr:lipid-A-disaccharide synthase [bacterium]